jgi:hypothetical protein
MVLVGRCTHSEDMSTGKSRRPYVRAMSILRTACWE